MKDGYTIFFNDFGISNRDIIEFGLREAIFIPEEKVELEWQGLKDRIFDGKETVFIRGYGRDGSGTQNYLNLYSHLFGHENFKKDSNNNAEPKKVIQKLTGHVVGKHIQNYQISHVFGRTKNPFASAAPWNIVYLPKIIDPFTGHESKGELTIEFQKAFQEHTYNMYKRYIEEFNYLMIDLRDKVQECLEESNNHRFIKDAITQFDFIDIGAVKEVEYKMD